MLAVKFLILVMTVSGMRITVKNSKGMRQVEEDMAYAGAVEGKRFFAIHRLYDDILGGLLWGEASEACNDMNMKLAEITTEAQAKLIMSFVNATPIWNNKYFWVAGRDSWEPRQMSWNSTDIDVSEANVRLSPEYIVGLGNSYRSCLSFQPNPINPSFQIQWCTARRLQYRLCEV